MAKELHLKRLHREMCLEVNVMSENLNNSILSSTGVDVDAAARQGKAALNQGVKAARQGVKAAQQGIEYAQDHVGDGLDMVKSLTASLSDFVSNQPLVAVGCAFLIGYIAARMLRRASSASS
ncbi:MAG TPA: hypothetical protein VGY99_25475 [Candidatus Binataceae bacterium]|jgi:hypothetical protein|nr:hypothetical protein [Candidatus Binataceae bacterium]